MLSRLVFSVTYDCPISCNYCVTESGPWGGPALDAGFMRDVIDEARSLGSLRSVVFTGGEPLLCRAEVEETLRHARQHRLWTRIVTNSYWAATPECAHRTLKALREAGLSEINLSCDDLHQEHIPLENVRHAYQAARRLDLPVLIAHKQVKHGKITPEFLSSYLGAQLTEFQEGGPNPSTDLYSSAPTVPIGYRADCLDAEHYISYPESRGAWSAPCSGILSSIIVSPTKEVRICCGMIDQRVPELSVGSLERQSLAEIVREANSDLVANWLALEGPIGIMNFLRDKAPHLRFRERYVNHCHLCNEIFTREELRELLQRHAAEKAAGLALQRGFLEALRFKAEGGALGDNQSLTAHPSSPSPSGSG
jgi:organic radical activating enzyme